MRRLMIGYLLPVLAIFASTARGQAIQKKLIQLGWDIRRPAYVAEHIREMEKKTPFDGIMIRPVFGFTFHMKNISEEAAAAEIAAMAKIEWEKFTDNFIYFHCDAGVDWFDDAIWGKDGYILRNIGWCAKAARVGRCVGLAFDPEFTYWGEPASAWNYEKQPRKDEKSFDEFEAMVRKRGRQYMDRIEEEFPNPVLLNTFWVSMSDFQKVAGEPDPVKRREMLKELNPYYALLPAFMTGMLEAADPGTVIVDGNESAYYNNTPLAYYQQYHNIHQAGQVLVPPELRYKYRAQVECGQAVFADQLCNTRSSHTISTYLTPSERARWVEHNVYWALRTSDGYVWFYNQQMNWWSGWNIPDYLTDAIQSAKDKVAGGEPLGFEIGDFVERGWREYLRAEHRPIEPRSARIPVVPENLAAPVVDGNLDDPAWQKAAVVGPFVNYALARIKQLEGTTEARMTFDENRLYVAFVCHEPDMASVVGAKEFQDDQLTWVNDVVEIAIAADAQPSKYYHIRISSENAHWDSLTNAGKEIYGRDSSWDGDYDHAVHKGKDFWSVEVAIPWETLKRNSPAPGEEILGNLVRRTHRRPNGIQEFSSWSESRRARYMEAEHFGKWIFGEE